MSLTVSERIVSQSTIKHGSILFKHVALQKQCLYIMLTAEELMACSNFKSNTFGRRSQNMPSTFKLYIKSEAFLLTEKLPKSSMNLIVSWRWWKIHIINSNFWCMNFCFICILLFSLIQDRLYHLTVNLSAPQQN